MPVKIVCFQRLNVTKDLYKKKKLKALELKRWIKNAFERKEADMIKYKKLKTEKKIRQKIYSIVTAWDNKKDFIRADLAAQKNYLSTIFT